MACLRRALSRVVVTWLLCQVATMTLAPAALSFGPAEELLECRCTHGDHAVCPMHHKPAPGSKLCSMGSAEDDGTAVLASLFGAVGLLPASISPVPPEPRRSIVRAESATRSLRPAPPDPPPPRL